MELISECSMRFAEDKDFRLLIVDSIMALFRVDFSGRGELSERQQKLAQMLSKLTKLTEEFNIAVLITNQVQSDPGATMTFVAGGALKPIGGHILSHSSATRMFLRKGKSLTPAAGYGVIRWRRVSGAESEYPVLTLFIPYFQDVLKNVLRSSWIAPTALKAKLHISWTKVDGPTCDTTLRA